MKPQPPCQIIALFYEAQCDLFSFFNCYTSSPRSLNDVTLIKYADDLTVCNNCKTNAYSQQLNTEVLKWSLAIVLQYQNNMQSEKEEETKDAIEEEAREKKRVNIRDAGEINGDRGSRRSRMRRGWWRRTCPVIAEGRKGRREAICRTEEEEKEEQEEN